MNLDKCEFLKETYLAWWYFIFQMLFVEGQTSCCIKFHSIIITKKTTKRHCVIISDNRTDPEFFTFS